MTLFKRIPDPEALDVFVNLSRQSSKQTYSNAENPIADSRISSTFWLMHDETEKSFDPFPLIKHGNFIYLFQFS